MIWSELICKRNGTGEILMLKSQILITDIYWTSFFNPLVPNFPVMEKPGSWFTLTNVWKTSVTLLTVFLTHFVSSRQQPSFSVSET